MPRIAVVANEVWNLRHFRLPLMKRLMEDGYDVVGMAPNGLDAKLLIDEKISFVPLKNLNRKSRNPVGEVQLMHELKKIYREERIDLALQFTIKPNIYGSLASKKLNTKTICTVTGLGYTFLNKGMTSRIAQMLYRKAFKHTEKIFFQNSSDRDFFINSNLVASSKTGIVAGSGINTEYYSPIPKKNSSEIVFVFVGRLLIDKGIVEFLEASQDLAKTHPNWKFYILGKFDSGNPSNVSRVKMEKALKSTSCIEYLGEKEDVRQVLSRADVLVLPSYREGMPRAVLEAMSMAIPVVVTNVAGCKDCVEHGVNGLLVEPRSSASLIQGMRTMGEATFERRQKLGNEGRNKVLAYFDEKIVVNTYLEEIGRLLKH